MSQFHDATRRYYASRAERLAEARNTTKSTETLTEAVEGKPDLHDDLVGLMKKHHPDAAVSPAWTQGENGERLDRSTSLSLGGKRIATICHDSSDGSVTLHYKGR